MILLISLLKCCFHLSLFFFTFFFTTPRRNEDTLLKGKALVNFPVSRRSKLFLPVSFVFPFDDDLDLAFPIYSSHRVHYHKPVQMKTYCLSRTDEEMLFTLSRTSRLSALSPRTRAFSCCSFHKRCLSET